MDNLGDLLTFVAFIAYMVYSIRNAVKKNKKKAPKGAASRKPQRRGQRKSPTSFEEILREIQEANQQGGQPEPVEEIVQAPTQKQSPVATRRTFDTSRKQKVSKPSQKNLQRERARLVEDARQKKLIEGSRKEFDLGRHKEIDQTTHKEIDETTHKDIDGRRHFEKHPVTQSVSMGSTYESSIEEKRQALSQEKIDSFNRNQKYEIINETKRKERQQRLLKMLRNSSGLKDAIILKEILDRKY